ncbi:hypothetical protein GDO86_015223 [Hymenochirus boettgeri]|uniref:Uncharacterized protein n=1 Tax=Hymenochirus boettgeri TaxID=247094 RepID=A0A8T2JWL2_9PIPI|nr:hypothetical protein GDO86_015223 [Hymenochirus boettgeri]
MELRKYLQFHCLSDWHMCIPPPPDPGSRRMTRVEWSCCHFCNSLEKLHPDSKESLNITVGRMLDCGFLFPKVLFFHFPLRLPFPHTHRTSTKLD